MIKASCKISPRIVPTFFLLLLILLSYVFCSVTSWKFNNTDDHNQSRFESEKIREYLKTINKPAVKTIKSLDGDLIDCVLFHQQLAFDNPRLQGHKPITDLPAMPKGFLSDNNNESTTFDEEVFQVWRMSGESCPENTIPVRRTTEEDVLMMTFQRKEASHNGYVHEYAMGFVQGEFRGSDAFINVWKPRIRNKNQMSSSQLRVMAGIIGGPNRDSIEVGSQVNYGDVNPRLFTRWTRGTAHRSTVCYNLQCKGFVQISSKIALGGALVPVSTYNGKQYEIGCKVWKAPMDGNWWLAIKGIYVGYWPSSLFTHLGGTRLADELQFGGEVRGPPSSSTEMGSGHFPKGGFRKAVYVGRIVVLDRNQSAKSSQLNTLTTNTYSYGVEAFLRKDSPVEAYVFYGGPRQ